MEEKLITIHYSELGLKKGNRGFFEQHLLNNIKMAVKDLPIDKVVRDYGRFFIELNEDSPVETVIERLKDVIGIAYFSVAYRGNPDVEILKEQILEKLSQESFETFAIDTRRADKQFPLTSVEVNQIVGERIHTALNKPANLKKPDLRCRIEIYNKKVMFSYQRIEGLRGLPVRSAGTVVSLLSSGIDSPVATYRMMTRGCKIVPVHFHSYPFTDKSTYHNAIQLAKHLTRFQNSTKFYLVPLAKIQEAIIANSPAKLRLILYRRAMLRLAEMIAIHEKALALVTGESVGQVASQTLENIAVISDVVSMPMLRPLIGMDKEMIIEQAKAIGTFETSIEPYDDCCSFLVPQNPETRAQLEKVEEAELKIENMPELLAQSLEQAEIMKLRYPPTDS